MIASPIQIITLGYSTKLNQYPINIQINCQFMNNNESYPELHLIKYMSQASKQDTPLLATKIISADEYSKNKIAELQDEIAKLRKQMAQRECIWSKEKNQLLSKAEILNLQMAETKQRLAQVVKINQTMEMALGAREEADCRTVRKDDEQLKAAQAEISEKNKSIKEMRKVIDELKKKIMMIEDQKNRVLEAKDQKISALTVANNQLVSDQQAQITKIKKQLASLPFNREIIAAIMRIFTGINSQELTYEDLLDDQYCESPVTKRYNENKDWSRNLKHKDSSFSRISSHSIISQLNTNHLQSEYSEDDTQKLLCEVCRRVYEQNQFINHMDQCNKMKLQQNRQRIQKDLRELDQEHRKSLSQLKRKPAKEMDNPLRDLTNNSNIHTNSSSKIQKKGSKVIKEPQQRPGNFSQLINNDYRSSKFY